MPSTLLLLETCEGHDGCCQIQTGGLETSRELEPGPGGGGGNKDKDNDDDLCGDIPAWMFKKSNQEELRRVL